MKTVLVVDDLAIVREPLAASLRGAGYQTMCASDGKEALKLAHASRPDLVLLDLAMPCGNGLEFLRALRSTPALREVPVIVLTADGDRQRVIEVAGLGVREYLLKSQFSLDKLVARLRIHLETESPQAGSETAADPAGVATRVARGSTPESSGSAPATSELAADLVTSAVSPPAEQGELSISDPAQSVKSMKPIVTRTQITQLIEDGGELKAMSPTVMQILKLTQSANCSIDQVVRTIKQDHAIALKVLKLANSVVYTRGEPVDNVQKAVVRIGLAQIRQAVLNLSVVEQFSSDEHKGPIDILQFWEHSIATGLICSELARATNANENEIDAFFTMGLLHDLGRLVYAEKLGETYMKVIALAAELELPLEQVESRLLLVDHASAMDRILHRWSFPKELINPIAFHHLSLEEIQRMPRHIVPQVTTLALANRLAHALLLGSSGNHVVSPIEDYCRALKLSPSVLTEIQELIPGQTDDMKLAMIHRGAAGDWPQISQTLQQQLERPFQPIFISGEPGLDGYRILTDRLRSREGDGAPNVALVHFAGGGERVTLTAALEAAEREAGVANLPVVLMSQEGKVQLENRAMAGRRSIRITTPVHIPQLIRVVNRLLMQ